MEEFNATYKELASFACFMHPVALSYASIPNLSLDETLIVHKKNFRSDVRDC
jgi:hypothetical protein